MTGQPNALTQFAPSVNRRLAELLESEEARWSLVDPDLAVPLDRLAACVLSGGKRLRPAFCYWAFIGAGGASDDPAVIGAGAAIEMLHTAALVHDDVIDGSVRRHGLDTMQVQYE